MSSTHAHAIAEGSDLVYGFELVEAAPGRVRGKLVVREELKQRLGAVHGGVFAVIAERLTALATARAVAADGKTVAPISNHTSFLRPITEGTIHVLAVARHRGKTTWVWEIEFSDDQQRLCVLSRMTLAISEASGS